MFTSAVDTITAHISTMSTSELIAAVAPVAKPARAPRLEAPKVTLLETVRALDGNKEERFHAAQCALYSAYTQALQHGNKTQLTEMLNSDGKKVCEKAMRTAVQTVGVLGMHKDSATRNDAIEMAVTVAADIFAAIACKVSKPRAVKAKPLTGTAFLDLATMQPGSAGVSMAAGSTSDTPVVGAVHGDITDMQKALELIRIERDAELGALRMQLADAQRALEAAQTDVVKTEIEVPQLLEAVLTMIRTGALSADERELLEIALLTADGIGSTGVEFVEVSTH